MELDSKCIGNLLEKAGANKEASSVYEDYDKFYDAGLKRQEKRKKVGDEEIIKKLANSL